MIPLGDISETRRKRFFFTFSRSNPKNKSIFLKKNLIPKHIFLFVLQLEEESSLNFITHIYITYYKNLAVEKIKHKYSKIYLISLLGQVL